jgi:3-hydroxyisobutyrate dehydrogenase-like beta-hydroxyacid dehydrogenase
MAAENVVGLVGLGLVGRAIAARLAGAGFEVLGYDCLPEAMRTFDGKATAEALKAPRIVLAVFDTADVEQVVAQSSARFYVDCTTGDPPRVEALAASLAARGVGYVDAPLSGSSEMVRRGEAPMYVGGDAAGCEDLLAAIATRRHAVGQVGRGMRAKLAANLVLGLTRTALAEAMAFAESLGLERAKFLELIADSSLGTPGTLAKGRRMVSGDFAPESRIRQHLKDVRRMLERSPIPLPLTAAHEKLLSAAVAAGDGDLDNAGIIRQLARR